MKIRETLWEKGCDVPLVADIHFAPAVALRVADAFEKVHMVIWMRPVYASLKWYYVV